MAKKEFRYRGRTLEELQSLGINELAELLPSRQRRSIKKDFTEAQKILLKKVRTNKKNIKTHCRDMIVLPEMIGKTFKVYNAKKFEPIIVQEEMIGHFFGEYVLTRNRVAHNAPGVGATRSSSGLSVR